ncbi:MAG TPA: glycosyltransferase family 4 protein [Baekduia sp.]|uniref:glycosyltransferase family 4 protein n=1 Tax=Baekduia sp. TaxID=2600305 RepID=UPI002B66925D|nr:glycosyltransferase family 4 protein [Baekduia sp.]HMJ37318.1 glycosyltransferase family 4 protein [Baekduia sp.]
MKVALVTSRYPSHDGGLERPVRELARGLMRRGASVEVITPECEPRMRRESRLEGVLVRRFPGPDHHNARFPVTAALSEHLRRTAGAFDLVHVHSAHVLLGLAAIRARPRRLVYSPLTPMARLLCWPYGRATRSVVDRAALTICATRADADVLCGACPEAADRVLVVPLGIDAAAIQAAAPFSALSTVVLTVGRLERRKRVDRAIAAMASLPPMFELVVVGDGHARRRLMGHAADLAVSSRVRFAGPVADAELHRWLRTARLVVALSEEEAFGLQVLEGIAAGAWVVASDIPAHREVSHHVGDLGITFVSPEGSPLEVAEAIRHAVAIPAPAPARSLPSWAEVVDRTLALYEELMRRRPTDAARRARHGRPRPLERRDPRDVAVEG